MIDPIVARSMLAFMALPGLFALFIPLVVGHAAPWRGTGWPPGLAAVLAGGAVLLWCARDFAVSGRGTLAPWDPPLRLVVVGLYRHVRNPMYAGVLLLVAGLSLYFTSPLLAAYAGLLAVGFHIRVVFHEEPWLASHFGAQWRRYARHVPRWLPRLAPRPNGNQEGGNQP